MVYPLFIMYDLAFKLLKFLKLREIRLNVGTWYQRNTSSTSHLRTVTAWTTSRRNFGMLWNTRYGCSTLVLGDSWPAHVPDTANSDGSQAWGLCRCSPSTLLPPRGWLCWSWGAGWTSPGLARQSRGIQCILQMGWHWQNDWHQVFVPHLCSPSSSTSTTLPLRSGGVVGSSQDMHQGVMV